MARPVLTEKDLSRELQDFEERFPKLDDHELFLVWFLRAYVTDEEEHAAKALTGMSGDKGLDAILVDDTASVVFAVQSKYRKKIGAKSEGRGDVISFAETAQVLAAEDGGAYKDFVSELDGSIRDRVRIARQRVRKRNYRLQLLYVTTGKCSKSLRLDAERIVRRASEASSFALVDGRKVLILLSDYLDGVAPPIPSLDLEMETGRGVQVGGIHDRYDTRTKTSSWVFSMNAAAVADLYERAGNRLFARNIRGFLGSTAINREMEITLSKEPERFWHYNNGITIVCDSSESIKRGGREFLRVSNPQVINGQQTLRTLYAKRRKGLRAGVLVRVIHVPRKLDGDDSHFEGLVSKIVAATNWQNAIRQSDLMSNDRRQVELERNLRKLGYQYLRKRETKAEARRRAAAPFRYLIKKEELAQAVAACDLDPLLVRLGKEGLFEEGNYERIFSHADPHYYLSRYWLMKQVAFSARGYPERAYAKWLVLNFVWPHLQPLVRSREGAERFRRLCEKNDSDLNPLIFACDSTFNAALSFFRSKRGKGRKAIDVSTFFQRKGLEKQFSTFWRGSKNRYRNPFRKRFGKFALKVREV